MERPLHSPRRAALPKTVGSLRVVPFPFSAVQQSSPLLARGDAVIQQPMKPSDLRSHSPPQNSPCCHLTEAATRCATALDMDPQKILGQGHKLCALF